MIHQRPLYPFDVNFTMLYSLPVLMYHSISRFKNYLCLPPELFEDHCRTLSEAGWTGISLPEAEDYFLKRKRLPNKVCLFTFDDGYLDNFVYAEPILRQYGHHGVIFPVLGYIESGKKLRPNKDLSAPSKESDKFFAALDKRRTMSRSGRNVAKIQFCNWEELKHMHFHGSMMAAPHSIYHSRVVRGLKFTSLFAPQGRGSFFSVPPYEICYGFPRFDLGHALASRGYQIVPEVFEIARSMVPQEVDAAKKFLSSPSNRQNVLDTFLKLPCLGFLESKEQYRQRIAEELVQSRDVFHHHFGVTPISFCWPWGDFTKTSLEVARDLGFRVFFSTGRKANRFGKANAVHRITIRQETGQQVLQKVKFASNAALEDIYGFFPF